MNRHRTLCLLAMIRLMCLVATKQGFLSPPQKRLQENYEAQQHCRIHQHHVNLKD